MLSLSWSDAAQAWQLTSRARRRRYAHQFGDACTQDMSISVIATQWRGLAPYLLSTLRITAAFLFMQFGTTKWFAFPASILPDGGTVQLASLLGVAAILEVVGGLLLLVGLFTRPVAFLLSGEMAVAYFIGPASQGFWPVLNQGTPAILFCFLWLYMSAAGPGPWSLDVLKQRLDVATTTASGMPQGDHAS
jgi:putative oxidoreductase